MGKKKINGDFEILFHPDLELEIKEIRIVYSTSGGKTWDDYYANKLSEKKYQISIYDLPEDELMEFYIEVLIKDGRVLKAIKDGKNYQVQLTDKGEGSYKAQIRIKELEPFYKICIICENIIPKDQIHCLTKECEATYCPICNRILPPNSNYCPWDEKMIN